MHEISALDAISQFTPHNDHTASADALELESRVVAASTISLASAVLSGLLEFIRVRDVAMRKITCAV